MRKLLALTVFLIVIGAAPAIAQDPNYPPSDPPAVCTDPPCTTAHTGFGEEGAFPFAAGAGLLVLGTVALVAARRSRQ